MLPCRALVNLVVGEEIILCLKDPTAFINTLARTLPFALRVHFGVARNQFGCLGFLVFWIPSPFNDQIPLAIYDLYVNPQNEALLGVWRELAFQTHWHLVLLDRKNKQRNLFEFENKFRIGEFLDQMMAYCQAIPIVDFGKAKAEFMAARSVQDLFDEGNRPPTNFDTEASIYDDRFAVCQASPDTNPLLEARYVRIVRESISRHSKHGTLPARKYLDGKLSQLNSELSKKKLIYLDVCHWIKLRQVWLRDEKALPVYGEILYILLRLMERGLVVCPLSMPIFEELMKQLDSRSRAATANLMQLFSRGITLLSFQEAFALDCKAMLSPKGHPAQTSQKAVTKVGFWLGDEEARTAWWNRESADFWEQLRIDLCWEMNVCDCQRLSARGSFPHRHGKLCLSKWMELPARQKAAPRSFWELVKECKSDIVEASLPEVNMSMDEAAGRPSQEGTREQVLRVIGTMVDSKEYGQIPCSEIAAGMCAAQVIRGGKVRANDIFDFLHASAAIPTCSAYFCDGPMEHLIKSKALHLNDYFSVRIHSRPEDILEYLRCLLEGATQTEGC